MRISRHIAVRTDSPDLKQLESAGVEFGDQSGILCSTSIFEDDARWPKVSAILVANEERRIRHPNLTDTELLNLASLTSPHFSEQERAEAAWLNVSTAWMIGYPQPEDEWPSSETFDLSEHCSHCGIGRRQIAPYMVSKPPKWGKRWLAGLFWVPDALFIRRDIFEDTLKPHDIEGRELLQFRGRQKVPDAVQLMPHSTVSLQTDGLERTECHECGRSKFSRPLRDSFPMPRDQISTETFRSQEWFGEGASAYQPLFLSQQFYQELRTLEGRQVQWHPCSSSKS